MLESEGGWQVWKDGRNTEVNGSSATVCSASTVIRLWVLRGENSAGNRTKAITHTSFRLSMRVILSFVNNGNLTHAGQWDSALHGRSVLRAHMHGTCSTWRGFIARGVGATSDRINAQLLILLLVYRGYFLCDVGIAWLTLYAVISSVIVPHSGVLHPKLFLVEGSLQRARAFSRICRPCFFVRRAP